MRSAISIVKSEGNVQDASTLHEVLDSLPGNCVLLEESGQILYVNLAWRKFAMANGLRHQLYGAGQNYLETCRRSAQQDPLAQEALSGITDVLKRRRNEFSLEYPCHSPDEKRWFMMTASRLRCEGQAAVLVMHANITQRVLSEHEADERCAELKTLIERRREYEEQLAHFYSMITHDIRSPMTSVLGSISLINGLCSANLDDDTKSLLDSAEFASKQILALVNDFLDHKKIEASKMDCRLVDVSCEKLLNDTHKMVDGLARSAGVGIVVNCTADMVRCDSDAILRVVTNLVSNAIKFTPSGKNVYLEASPLDDAVLFTIRDEGRGMSESVKDRLFQPFAVSEVSSVLPGSGLGLMVVKSLLEQHGAVPLVESSEGEGTTIRFELARGF